MPEDSHQPGQLKRQLGVFHAVLLGLGSILGTGVFVSIGIAAGIAGPAVLIAIVLAALLALCNGLSSAQLAAAHPVAGGTYEYGYRFLHPKLGFTAGWMFLLAKSASAATAALGVVAYIVSWLPGDKFPERWLFPVGGTLAVLALVFVTLLGIRRAALFNAIVLAITLVGLMVFIIGAAFQYTTGASDLEIEFYKHSFSDSVLAVIAATPLVFVAFTGYGRIATLGEEIKDPRRTIPLAVVVTLGITCALYLTVGFFVGNVADHYWTFVDPTPVNDDAMRSSSLQLSAWYHNIPHFWIVLIAIAAITAMLGVLLNLVLGLSRVLLAMGRRRDVPGLFAKVNDAGTTPVPAVIGVGVLIAGLTLLGDVKTTWSFAAFTVLIYYGITNLAALRLPAENRLYPRGFAWAGLGGCLFLAWWVQPVIWLVGCGLIVLGLVWHQMAPKMFGPPPAPDQRCVVCGYDLRASTGSCPECGHEIPGKAVT